MSQQFKPPRKVLAEVTNVVPSNSSTSSTEDMSTEALEARAVEDMVRGEVQNWLDTHGAKLFALEASKFNAQEARRRNIRSNR